MPRFRDLGFSIGSLPVGPTNSILDVGGVGVGHATVWRDESPPPEGRGVARTGVTVVDPGGDCFDRPIPFGATALNGAGEMTGYLTSSEWGLLESPIFLTSTMQLGRVYDAACRLLISENTQIGPDDVLIPVVAECDDSFVNNARVMQVEDNDVADALRNARNSVGSDGPPDEGSVGSGTGMACLGFNGGIGTSSRLVPEGFTVGVLVMTNFGDFERLTIDGVPVGRRIPDPRWKTRPSVPILGLKAPASSSSGPMHRSITPDASGWPVALASAWHGPDRRRTTAAARSSWRSPPGLARLVGRRGSQKCLRVSELNSQFEAVIDATEEAVLNSMLMSPTVVGRDGNTLVGLSADVVLEQLGQR